MDLMDLRRAVITTGPHLVSVSGNPIQINNVEYAPAKQCRITFSPVQSGTGDPSPSNVRAISGLTGLTLSWCGKNLFDSNAEPFTTGQYISSVSDGRAVTTSNANYNIFAIPVNENTQYAVGVIKASDPMYAFIDAFGIVLSSGKNSGSTSGTVKTLTSPAGSTALLLSVAVKGTYKCDNILQVESGPATSYEAYSASTVPVSWQTEAGVVYAGEIDLINGTLTKTHEYTLYTGDNGEDWSMQTIDDGKNYFISFTQAAQTYTSSDLFCNMAKTKTSDSVSLVQGEIFVSRYHNLNVCLGTASGTSSLAEWRTWLSSHNLQVVYRLANPITYQLTPQTIRTMRGRNNIITNAVGNMSASVWTY